jgi:hypothetical protein
MDMDTIIGRVITCRRSVDEKGVELIMLNCVSVGGVSCSGGVVFLGLSLSPGSENVRIAKATNIGIESKIYRRLEFSAKGLAKEPSCPRAKEELSWAV